MNNAQKTIVILLLVAMLLLSFGCTKPQLCKKDTKLCPDGTYVGRVGATCDFAKCADFNCPLIVAPSPDFCKDGNIVDGGKNQFGCQNPPKCQQSQCLCSSGYVNDSGICVPLCYYSMPACSAPSVPCVQENIKLKTAFDVADLVSPPWTTTFTRNIPDHSSGGEECLQAHLENSIDVNQWHKFWFCNKDWNGVFITSGVTATCDCKDYKIFHTGDTNSLQNITTTVAEQFK